MSTKNLFSFLSHNLNENNCRLTNNFEGKGPKRLTSAKVMYISVRMPECANECIISAGWSRKIYPLVQD